MQKESWGSVFSFLKNENGNAIIMAIIGVSALIGVSVTVLNLQRVYTGSEQFSRESIEFRTQYFNASETLYYIYKNEEQKYYASLGSCLTANTFMKALAQGSGCSINVTVFKASSSDVGFALSPTGCVIRASSSTCANVPLEILKLDSTMTARGKLNPFSDYKFSFSIFNFDVVKSRIEFVVNIEDDTSTRTGAGTRRLSQRKRTLAISENLRSVAHIEADGRVVGESPDPESRCPTSDWADIKVFNPSTLDCERFDVFGGALGLAFYDNRYFALRSSDGNIIDMLAALRGEPYNVGEDGKIGSKKVFVPYNKELLLTVDDITTIGETIYYVEGDISTAHIGYIDAVGSRKVKVCDLSALGWPQANVGILARARSNDLTDLTKIGNIASFYVKGYTGYLLTVIAQIDSTGAYQCSVIKDAENQRIEYARNFGFERTTNTAAVIHY